MMDGNPEGALRELLDGRGLQGPDANRRRVVLAAARKRRRVPVRLGALAGLAAAAALLAIVVNLPTRNLQPTTAPGPPGRLILVHGDDPNTVIRRNIRQLDNRLAELRRGSPPQGQSDTSLLRRARNLRHQLGEL